MKKKKIIVLALCGMTVAASLIGCGSMEEPDKAVSVETVTEKSTENDAAEEATENEATEEATKDSAEVTTEESSEGFSIDMGSSAAASKKLVEVVQSTNRVLVASEYEYEYHVADVTFMADDGTQLHVAVPNFLNLCDLDADLSDDEKDMSEEYFKTGDENTDVFVMFDAKFLDGESVNQQYLADHTASSYNDNLRDVEKKAVKVNGKTVYYHIYKTDTHYLVDAVCEVVPGYVELVMLDSTNVNDYTVADIAAFFTQV